MLNRREAWVHLVGFRSAVTVAAAAMAFDLAVLAMAVDGLGYVFMSLAALFAAAAFDGGRLERRIRQLLLATGMLGVPILLTYFVDRRFIYAAGLWGITVPASAIFLAAFFRRRC